MARPLRQRHRPPRRLLVPAPRPEESRFLSFSNPRNHLKLSSSEVSFTSDTLNAKDQTLAVGGTGTATKDGILKLSLGGTTEAVTSPVCVKSMKKRTVRIAVHKVYGKDKDGNLVDPSALPPEADLEAYLNQVYGRQTNTFFDATYYEEGLPGGIKYDENGDGKLMYQSNEENLATVNRQSPGTAHLDIWVVAGVKLQYISDGNVSTAYGYQYYTRGGDGQNDPSTIVIDGSSSRYPGSNGVTLFKNTIAHEIGHAIITDGLHADDKKSKSYLDGLGAKEVQKRLMCSGQASDLAKPGCQLIKNEWDLIEGWLKNEENNHRL